MTLLNCFVLVLLVLSVQGSRFGLRNNANSGLDISLNSNNDLVFSHLNQQKITFQSQYSGAATINGAILGTSLHNRTAALRFSPSPILSSEDVQAYVNGQWTSLTLANFKPLSDVSTNLGCSASTCMPTTPLVTYSLNSFVTLNDAFVFQNTESGSLAIFCSLCGTPLQQSSVFPFGYRYSQPISSALGSTTGYIIALPNNPNLPPVMLLCDFTSLQTFCPTTGNCCQQMTFTGQWFSTNPSGYHVPPKIGITSNGNLQIVLYNSAISEYTYAACVASGLNLNCALHNLGIGFAYTINSNYPGLQTLDSLSVAPGTNNFFISGIYSSGTPKYVVVWACVPSSGLLNNCNVIYNNPISTTTAPNSGISGQVSAFDTVASASSILNVFIASAGYSTPSTLPWSITLSQCTITSCSINGNQVLVGSRSFDQTGDQIPYNIHAYLSVSNTPVIGFSFGYTDTSLSQATPVTILTCIDSNCNSASVVRSETHLSTNNGVFLLNLGFPGTGSNILTTPNWGTNNYNLMGQIFFSTYNLNPGSALCSQANLGELILLGGSPYVCSKYNLYIPSGTTTTLWAWISIVDGNLHNDFSVPIFIA